MKQFNRSRRRVLAGSLSAFGLMAMAPLARSYAAALIATPAQTRGPFYPVQIPLDSDNDLVVIEGGSGIAEGEISNVVGRVLDERGRPIGSVRVEIWQCDAHGVYRHPGDPRPNLRDTAFQGFGRTVSDSEGRFNFRTIVPVPYPGRTPHIHAKIIADGRAPLTTQFYLADYRDNARDFLFNRMTSDERERVSMEIRRQSGNDRAAWETDIVVALPSAG